MPAPAATSTLARFAEALLVEPANTPKKPPCGHHLTSPSGKWWQASPGLGEARQPSAKRRPKRSRVAFCAVIPVRAAGVRWQVAELDS